MEKLACGSCSHSISPSPKLTQDRNTVHVFCFLNNHHNMCDMTLSQCSHQMWFHYKYINTWFVYLHLVVAILSSKIGMGISVELINTGHESAFTKISWKQKMTYLIWEWFSITKNTHNTVNQSKLEVITGSWRKARENACEWVTIGFGITSDWMKNWCEFFEPIV